MKRKIMCFLCSALVVLCSCLPVPVQASTLAVGAFAKILINLAVSAGVTYEVGKVLGVTGTNSEIMVGGVDAINGGSVNNMVLPNYTSELDSIYNISDLIDVSGITAEQAVSIEKEYNRYISNPNAYAPNWNDGLTSAISQMLYKGGIKYIFETVSFTGDFKMFPVGWEDFYKENNFTDYFRVAWFDGSGDISYHVYFVKYDAPFNFVNQGSRIELKGVSKAHIYNGAFIFNSYPSSYEILNGSSLTQYGRKYHYYDLDRFPDAKIMIDNMHDAYSSAYPGTGTGDLTIHDKKPYIPMPNTSDGFIYGNQGSLGGSIDDAKDTVLGGITTGDVTATDNVVDTSKPVTDTGSDTGIISGILDGIQSMFDWFTSPVTVSIDFSAFDGISIADRFPFCLPFDLIESIKGFSSRPVAPYWKVELLGTSFDIDFSQFQVWADIVRYFVGLLFVVNLVRLTKSITQ